MWKDQRMLWTENYYVTIVCPLNYNLENSKFAEFDKNYSSFTVLILQLKKQISSNSELLSNNSLFRGQL